MIDVGGRRCETIVQMLAAHRSQFFEWLPYNERRSDVPHADEERLIWLRRWYEQKIASRAERYRDELVAQYGPDRGRTIEFCEVFEISEYAAPLDTEARRRLFWFLP